MKSENNQEMVCLPDNITQHPCFSEKAAGKYGRIHLAVAPECNIQCNFCIRKFDCVNESRPGVTSKVISPAEALLKIDEIMDVENPNSVVGIAGPGEPLFNAETFETIRIVGEKYPKFHYCLSSNGLLLPEKIHELKKLNISNITVTLNTLDPATGAEIYSHIKFHGQTYSGIKGAEILLENQLEGIRMAISEGMTVKVNTVLIKSINLHQAGEIAEKVSKMGVYLQNLMPVIPQFKFNESHRPDHDELRKVREECARFVTQMRHCKQCRSDAIGKLC
ncbi:MAG: radical SAM protein [Candidatus Riflebacteria bacterium]|nr:radical SAM protein [Candidatus Riflebacteria bacterium]